MDDLNWANELVDPEQDAFCALLLSQLPTLQVDLGAKHEKLERPVEGLDRTTSQASIFPAKDKQSIRQ